MHGAPTGTVVVGRRSRLAEHQPGRHDQRKHGRRSSGGLFASGNEDGSGIPFSRRLGRCYELAGGYALDHDDAVLVHGSIQGFDNPRIGHGWVERGGEIYEPITNKMWHPAVFDALYNPVVDHRYTSDQLRLNIVRSRHWGPWEGSSGAYNDLKGKRREADR